MTDFDDLGKKSNERWEDVFFGTETASIEYLRLMALLKYICKEYKKGNLTDEQWSVIQTIMEAERKDL
jgi:hypothetical protein